LPASLRRLYHFVLLWGRKKRHNPLQREVLGSNSRQTQQSRLELGLHLSPGFQGRTIWIADAHRDNGKRFVVRSDEMVTAFLELERITHELAVSALLGDDVY
jgi:hypothetical protein